MRDGELRIEDVLDRGFTRHGEPPHEQVASDLARIRERLDPAVTRLPLRLARDQGPVPGAAQRLSPVVIAATAVVALVVGAGVLLRWSSDRHRADAIVEAVDGSLSGVSGGQIRELTVNGRIVFGDTVRSNGGRGGTLVLADGSRVEMRSQSELSLERADDGVRIRLNRGGIIVNAAKQRDGHLYVQTKDVTVSVVGTVFLVNAEEAGSRVAVIEGEVRIRRGTSEQKLLAGDEVATNPMMTSRPVLEDIAWSRHAEAHLELLEQRVAAAPASQPAEARTAFEEISIRPTRGGPVGGGRGGGLSPAGDGCGGGSLPQLDARRFYQASITVYELIMRAYPEWALPSGGCVGVNKANLLSGGPNWVKSDLWQIEAVIPAGTPTYTLTEIADGKAPVFQKMLQALLAERFKVVIRREMKEIPVLMLTVARGGPKFNGVIDLGRKIVFEGENGALVGPSEVRGAAKAWRNRDDSGRPYVRYAVFNMPLSEWTPTLSRDLGQLVLDRTALSGEHSFHFEYDTEGVTRPVFAKAIEEIGLKVEEARAAVELWVIEHAEKPTEN